MSKESIPENCLVFQHQGINERISVREAKQRYENRLNSGDSLNGFRFGLDELQDLINAARDLEAQSLRFWKGRRKVHDVCSDPNNPDLPPTDSEEFYIEDLIIMPVLLDGADYYAAEGSGNIESSNVDDSRDLILASSRPCPEWCNVKGIVGVTYFTDRNDLRTVTRDQTNAPAVLSIDHYSGKGCNKPEVNNP